MAYFTEEEQKEIMSMIDGSTGEWYPPTAEEQAEAHDQWVAEHGEPTFEDNWVGR